jgi:aldehyde dehydrogenase (NAD+)
VIEISNYIGGEWTPSVSGRTFERRNPADEREVVGVAPESDAKDVHTAVAAVATGYPEWAARTPETRADVLYRAADLLAARADELAVELVREEGKTLAEARTETRRTPANLRFYAGEALRLAGQTFASADGLVLTAREPVGVVGAITPWNFPLNIPSRKLGPALAAGNGVVFKPSEVTPLLGQRLVEVLVEAGVPAGALALVQGGAEAGAALVADEQVDAVTFTGSYAVGAAIHRAVAPTVRCQLEMGGKNAVVVLDDADAGDLGRAASIVMRGAFGLSGQACTGTSRLIVHEAVHDELVARITAAAAKLRVGNGLDDGVDMGPLATPAQLEKVAAYVPVDPPEHGHFVPPTVITGVTPDEPVAQDEIFGPVLAVLRVRSFEEAVAVANATQYGLSAGIVTRDVGRALAFARRVDAGVIKVNQPTTGVAMNAPFGGVKNSSTQTFKEQAGETMMHFYTLDKTVYLSS